MRSNSFAASPAVLQISHMRMFTISARASSSAASTASSAAMRAAGAICGHAPCPLSHAVAAAVAAAIAAASSMFARLPITARLPVAASRIGLVTSVASPAHGLTSPPMKVLLPSTNGLGGTGFDGAACSDAAGAAPGR